VSLLQRLPDGLAPSGSAASSYAPLAAASPGLPAPLRYLRYPAWSNSPLDVVVPRDGLLLGEGWAELAQGTDEVSRWAANDAELVINPLGSARRELVLDLEPAGPAQRPHELQVLSAEGRVRTRALVLGRQVVRLAVPVAPQRLGLVRLRLLDGNVPVHSGPGGCAFRVYRRGRGLLSARAPDTVLDVVNSGVRVGARWYPVEEYGGLR